MKMQINNLEVEVFEVDDSAPWNRELFPENGHYWWVCVDGFKPDSKPYGPFETETDSQQDAINTCSKRKVA